MDKGPGRQGGEKTLSMTKRKTNRKTYTSNGDDGIDRKKPPNSYHESDKFVQVYKKLREMKNRKKTPVEFKAIKINIFNELERINHKLDSTE